MYTYFPEIMSTVQDLYPTRLDSEFSISKREDPVVWKTPEFNVHALSKEELDFFEKNGYLFFNELFSKEEIQQLYDEIEVMVNDKEARKTPQYIIEPEGEKVRSIFEVHKNSKLFQRLAGDRRVANVARQILGSEVYIHQSRINLKSGFEGKEFFWHSDFETWHAEDGLPRMRTVSCSISLTDNYVFNGPLMVIPGSHKYFVSCAGDTPDEHYKESLKKQEIGTPDPDSLTKLVEESKIEIPTGPPGSALFFDCNIMHGSGGNMTPFPRSNVFFVYNSIHNKPVKPFAAKKFRPEYIGAKENISPIVPGSLN